MLLFTSVDITVASHSNNSRSQANNGECLLFYLYLVVVRIYAAYSDYNQIQMSVTSKT